MSQMKLEAGTIVTVYSTCNEETETAQLFKNEEWCNRYIFFLGGGGAKAPQLWNYLFYFFKSTKIFFRAQQGERFNSFDFIFVTWTM
jgi:hypothetical protein